MSLPVWIPGSYLVREFAKTCKTCTPARASAKSVCSRPTSTPGWPIATARRPGLDVRGLRLRQLGAHGVARCIARLFNGTSLCLRVHGQEQQPHTLEVSAPAAPTWSLATGLAALKVDKKALACTPQPTTTNWWTAPWKWATSGWASSPHAVCPTVCGGGAAPSFDGQRLLADTQKFAKPPFASGTARARPRSPVTCSCSTP